MTLDQVAVQIVDYAQVCTERSMPASATCRSLEFAGLEVGVTNGVADASLLKVTRSSSVDPIAVRGATSHHSEDSTSTLPLCFRRTTSCVGFTATLPGFVVPEWPSFSLKSWVTRMPQRLSFIETSSFGFSGKGIGSLSDSRKCHQSGGEFRHSASAIT